MSGFLAVVRLDGANPLPDALSALPTLRARGPHGEALWNDDSCALAYTRFVSHDGEVHQGIASLADGGRLVGHIRLDGGDELRAALRARVSDDASLFAAALDARGEHAPAGLLGDFAVASVHPAPSLVALRAWRDPLGVRPLFFTRTAGCVAVSNTMAVLLALPGVSDALDEQVVADFLDIGDAAEREHTWFKDIRRIPPAHMLAVQRNGTVAIRRYWTPPTPEILRLRDSREYPKRFRALLDEAVHDRLRTATATVIMSGGLDSTALAGIAVSVGGDARRIQAVSACYHEVVRSDETEFARLAARNLKIPLVEVNADRFGYLERWDQATTRIVPPGEPDLALWIELLRQAAAFGTTAFLGFDGDALLLPPSFRALTRRMSIWRVALDVFTYRVRRGHRPHLDVFGRMNRRPPATPHWPWLRPKVIAARQRPRPQPFHHPTNPEMWAGLSGPLWDHIFDSVDPGVTGILLDVRFPFLDRRVIDFALSVPPIPWTQRKLLLRESMRGVLPEPVRLRPKVAFGGYFEGRLAQLAVRKGPSPHVLASPARNIDEFVDISEIPDILPIGDFEQALALLRVRELNDWLNARAERPTT